MSTSKKTSGKSGGKKAAAKKQTFKVGQHIVYPAHGVGIVTGIDQEVIAGFDIELYVVKFEQDKMTLRVPTAKAGTSGMRPLSNELVLKDSFTTLKGRARIKRTMWSRRAQEYEAKINSGDLILVSDRMVREVAAIRKTDRETAMEDVLDTLSKARSRQAAKAAAEEEANNDAEGKEDGGVAAA